MKLIKNAIIVAVAATAVFGLTGCGAGAVTSAEETQTETHNGFISEYTVAFPTGDTVNCLLFDATASAGLVCDWNNLNAAGTEGIYSPRLVGSVEILTGTELLCVSYDAPHEGGLDCNIDTEN